MSDKRLQDAPHSRADKAKYDPASEAVTGAAMWETPKGQSRSAAPVTFIFLGVSVP